MKRLLCGLVAVGLLVGGVGRAKAQPSYVYTTLDMPGSLITRAVSINNVGQVVGAYLDADQSQHGFLLSGGTYSRTDVPGLVGTYLASINDSGQIVGTAIRNDHDPHGPDFGFQLSGGSASSIKPDIPGLPAYRTHPSGINNAGDIVGDFFSGDHSVPSYGFLRRGGNYTKLDVPGSISGSTSAGGINNAGQILVYSSRGYGLYQPASGTYTGISLRSFGTAYVVATGLDDADRIVGWYFDDKDFAHGYVLGDGMSTTVDVPGAEYTWPYGINNSGQIVGEYEAVDGTYHGFLATPVPEPSTLLLLIATVGVIGWTWRRRKVAKAHAV